MRVVPSPVEETESDDAGLHLRKSSRTVSVAMLLGGIGGILGGQFSAPRQKEVMVVPSSLEASPLPSAGSPLVNLGSDSMSGAASSSPGGSL